MRTLATIILATVLLLSAPASAQNPVTKSADGCAEGACGSYRSMRLASARKCLRASGAAGLPMLIPFNSMVTVTTTTSPGAWMCWVQSHHNDVSVAAGGFVTDQAGLPDGDGNCFFVVAGTYRTEPVPLAFGSAAIGRRTGVCRATATRIANGRPCRIDRDCDASHTCDAAADNTSLQTGAYLCTQSASTFTVQGNWIR